MRQEVPLTPTPAYRQELYEADLPAGRKYACRPVVSMAADIPGAFMITVNVTCDHGSSARQVSMLELPAEVVNYGLEAFLQGTAEELFRERHPELSTGNPEASS